MKHRCFFIVFAAIIFLCIALTALIYGRECGQVAKIYADGELVQSVDLKNIDVSYEIPIDYDGRENTILVERGQISMKSANCPDNLCVKQGAIHNGFYPIVCLPNKIVIQIDGGIRENDAPDAISK